jgi:Spy/CpxP family protein refolding chaperone
MESRQPNETPEAGEAGKGASRGECRRGGHRHGGRRFVGAIVLVLLAGAAGFAGGFASKAFGWGGPHGFLYGPMDPARAEQRAERMIKRLAGKVDATPEQREQLDVIAKAAVRDLLALRANVAQARTQSIALLSAPVVDRGAVEKLRAEQIGVADAASKRLAQALADAAEVLTVEQRKVLAERAQRFGERHGGSRG